MRAVDPFDTPDGPRAYVDPLDGPVSAEEARIAEGFRLGILPKTFADGLRCRECGYHHRGGVPQDDYHMFTRYKVAAGLPVWKHGLTETSRRATPANVSAWLRATGPV